MVNERKKITNKSIAPFEVNDTREKEFIDVEMVKFKKYMSDSDISMW